MTNRIAIKAYVGTDTPKTFKISNIPPGESIASEAPLNLEAIGVTRVTVRIDDITISSDDDSVEFSGDSISVKFGRFDLPKGRYYPVITIYYPDAPEGKVISGCGEETEIQLLIGCV